MAKGNGTTTKTVAKKRRAGSRQKLEDVKGNTLTVISRQNDDEKTYEVKVQHKPVGGKTRTGMKTQHDDEASVNAKVDEIVKMATEKNGWTIVVGGKGNRRSEFAELPMAGLEPAAPLRAVGKGTKARKTA